MYLPYCKQELASQVDTAQSRMTLVQQQLRAEIARLDESDKAVRGESVGPIFAYGEGASRGHVCVFNDVAQVSRSATEGLVRSSALQVRE